jgi:hypothetical protein
MDRKELGSKTAKGGFANEKSICKKFNSWKNDNEAQEWLKIMGYSIDKLSSVKAIQVPTRIKKTDLGEFEIDEKEYEGLRKNQGGSAPDTGQIGQVIEKNILSAV